MCFRGGWEVGEMLGEEVIGVGICGISVCSGNADNELQCIVFGCIPSVMVDIGYRSVLL